MHKIALNYKRQLTECLNLRAAGGKSAFQRAKILSAVYEDAGFRSDYSEADLVDVLDAYVEDLAIGFLHLRELLTAFPDEVKWADGKLRTLYDEFRELRRAQERSEAASNGEGKIRRSAKLEDIARVEAERDDAAAQLKYSNRRLVETETAARSAADRIAELERENSRLLGRIEELERMLSRSDRGAESIR